MCVWMLLISSLWMDPTIVWTWSVHPESSFKVMTPFPMELTITEIPTAAAPIKYHQYRGGSVEDTTLQLAFIIDHYQLDDQDLAGDDVYLQEFFGLTVDEILESVGGTLIYKDLAASAGQEMCIWKASYADGQGIIRGKIILAGDKYYGLQAFGLHNPLSEKNMDQFFSTFQITDQK